MKSWAQDVDLCLRRDPGGGTLRLNCIPSRGEKKYSLSLHATKNGIRSGLMSLLAHMKTYSYLYLNFVRESSFNMTREGMKILKLEA